MRRIRVLQADELERCVELSVQAYPGMRVSTALERSRMRDNLAAAVQDGRFALRGVFEAEHMVGVMRYHDFRMQLLSTRTLVGGLGGLAVDLGHRRRHVALDAVRHFLGHYRERGACLTALYPFRPDFYRRMGFGYGTKVSHYRLDPRALPAGTADRSPDHATQADADDLAACYDRFVDRTNGMMERPRAWWSRVLDDPSLRVVATRRDGRIGGYLVFRFELGPPDDFLHHDLLVHELVFDTPGDLTALLGFLRSLSDQVGRVLVNRQDEDFHLLLNDPRNGSGRLLPRATAHESNVQGVGLMYRVTDVRRLFEVLTDHDFGGQSCRVRLTVRDDFPDGIAGSTVVDFDAGRARLATAGACDVELALGAAELSSLIVGAASVHALVRYGLATVSSARHLATLERLFAAPRPQCLTDF